MKIIRIDSLPGTPFRASLMTDSAMRPDHRPLFLPVGDWICEIRPAIRIDRLGKAIAAKFARRYYANFTLVNYLRPTIYDNDFRYNTMDDAIVVGTWTPIDQADFTIDRNAIDLLIEYLSTTMTFKTGDIIILPDVVDAYIPEINQQINVSHILEFTIK